LLFSRYSQILLYSSPPDSCGTRGGVGALLSVEAGSGAVGHVVAPKPSLSREAGPGRVAGPLGSDVKDPGAPTTRVEDVNGSPLGGDVGDPGAPTSYVEDVDGGPIERRCQRSKSVHHLCLRHRWQASWKMMLEIRERPPPILKTLISGPLGSDAGDLGAPTTYVEDVDGGPPGRRCQRSGSAHHLC
jgi:hypothetical protein